LGKDYWPYLQNKTFDVRFEKALKMIGQTKNKIIFDLNCGTARILQYLPEGFKQYIGSDINKEFLETAKKRGVKGPTRFICCRDNEVIYYLN